jgi:molybdenum cofactor biosynthesis enzyme MoaA
VSRRKPITSVRLEASTACQLKCPSCPTASGRIDSSLGTGFLKFADFKNFLQHEPQVRTIELSNWGEVFLNPDLLKIMEYAHAKGVALSASNGANMNYIAAPTLEGLVKYGFNEITCSIDGATEETYRLYRKGGSLSTVLDNIRKINEFKLQHHSPHPSLTWQFIAFKHNEHEIEQAKAMAKSLAMKFRVKLAWDQENAPPETSAYADLIRAESGSGTVNRAEHLEKHGAPYLQTQICMQLLDSPQINYDGRVLGCCINHWGDFGNAFENGLTSVLESEKYTYAQSMLEGLAPERDDIPCTQCHNYKDMQAANKYLPVRRMLAVLNLRP